MNTPQESSQEPSYTEAYRALLAKNVAAGMDRDLADVKARQSLGLNMKDRDNAILAKNEPQYSDAFDDTYPEAEELGRKVREAEDARKRVESTVSAEALAVAQSIPRGRALEYELISDILLKTFGTDVYVSDRELKLLARDYKEHKDAIDTSGEWPALKNALLRTQEESKKAIPDLDTKADQLIKELRAA